MKKYAYFDWPFGDYIFKALNEYNSKEVQFIKFSLFDMLKIQNRFAMWEYFYKNKPYCEEMICEFIETTKPEALIVNFDWLKLCTDVIRVFHLMEIPVILILHEGVFQDEDIWYDRKIPIADKALVWGELHKRIFEKRGYPSENISVVGSVKLNQYKNFTPSISREDFFRKTGLNANQRTILYCCQLCDQQWGEQSFALKKQLEQITDIAKAAENNNWNFIVRNTTSRPCEVLPPEFVETFKGNKNIFIDGEDVDSTFKSTYRINAEDTIWYSDLIIGMDTTMQLEASLLNKPAAVIKYFDFDPKWHRELGLPVAKNYSELVSLIETTINLECDLISDDKKDYFCKEYGYNNDSNYSPMVNIEKFLIDFKSSY